MSGERQGARAPGRQGSGVGLSVVVPVRDEAGAIEGLAAEMAAALDGAGMAWEVVWVDDTSGDDTRACITALGPPHRLVTFDDHRGQGLALAAGLRAARGAWIATLDGDGQNDPADLPRLLAVARRGGLDAVLGVRTPRRDDARRRMCSRVANACRNRVLGERIRDAGCAVRIVSRAAARELPACPGLHVLVGSLLRVHGRRWRELPVGHRPRRSGSSHYGILDRLRTGIGYLRWLRAYRATLATGRTLAQ